MPELEDGQIGVHFGRSLIRAFFSAKWGKYRCSGTRLIADTSIAVQGGGGKVPYAIIEQNY